MSPCNCSQAAEYVTLAGRQLRILQACDRMVDRWATELAAESLHFAPLISLELLDEFDYLRSFPHLIHFAQVVTPEAQHAVTHSEHCNEQQALQSSGQALLPAACYPVYAHLRSARLSTMKLFTTVNSCFRNEDHFEPLRRQRCFTMREIVCVGANNEVSTFLARMRDRIAHMLTEWGISNNWQAASDPFFQVEGNGKALVQRLAETKKECIVDDLAIASTNLHGETFSRRFDIQLDDQLACTGCLAFGLERWIAVLQDALPENETAWPEELQG